MSAPRRLTEDTGVPEQIRADLRAAAQNAQMPIDTAQGLERLRQSIRASDGSGPLDGAGAPLSTPLLKTPLRWIMLVGSVGGTIAALWFWNSSREPHTVDPSTLQESQVVPSPSTPRSHSDVSERNQVVDSPKFDDEEAVTLEEHPRTTPPELSAQRVADQGTLSEKSAESAAAPMKADLFSREVQHLKELRLAFRENPSHAHQLAEEGHRLFRGGMLYEEREALLILSLQEAGRTHEAGARAELFRKQFPRSGFLSKMAPEGAPPEGTPQ